jgi:DNA-binding transcriptional LysR family regulator
MVEAGLGVAVVPSLAMPTDEHHVLVSQPSYRTRYPKNTWPGVKKGRFLSPAEKFREMLMKLWSQDKTSPWIGKFSH